ncbi:MAG: rod shape-determining protein, partial [Nitrospiraceae bacterium]
GTTDMALFFEGTVCHVSVLMIGGNNFTNDVAVGLRVPTHDAEILKRNHGCALLSLVRQNEEIEAAMGGGRLQRTVPRNYLVEILQPRAEELFTLIKKELMAKGFHGLMNSGVVLTGGASLMEGMDIMAENILELPARIGEPRGVRGPADIVRNPLYAAAAGLALHGAAEDGEGGAPGVKTMISGIGGKMKGWLKNAFH